MEPGLVPVKRRAWASVTEAEVQQNPTRQNQQKVPDPEENPAEEEDSAEPCGEPERDGERAF